MIILLIVSGGNLCGKYEPHKVDGKATNLCRWFKYEVVRLTGSLSFLAPSPHSLQEFLESHVCPPPLELNKHYPTNKTKSVWQGLLWTDHYMKYFEGIS